MTKKKADKATVEARINEVLAIRGDGAAVADILHYSAEKAWGGSPGVGLKERQIREYVRRADQLVLKRLEKRRSLVMGLHLARRETLFARAVAAGDQRAALAVLDSTAKLQGLFSDPSDMKALVKLVAEQEQRIKDLETRVDASTDPRPSEEPQPEA